MPSASTIPSLSRPVVTVVAGLIHRNGQILIGQRPKGEWHEFKWEFPGGKMEAAESPQSALMRELREELDIEAEIGEEITRYQYQYPGKPPIHLIFFRVVRFEGEPRNLAFEEIRWEEPTRFPDYDFLDGDIDFVRRIARGEI
jgi:8-oxo-dGTP diphosphatase